MSDTGFAPLDLGDADTSGIEAIDAGRYPAVLDDLQMDTVKNTSGRGSLEAGTPMIKARFRITQEINGSTNRKVFNNYYPILPKGYDKTKAARLKGMFVNFLVALGEDEDAVRAKGYELDRDELIGRECVVTVGKEQKQTWDGEKLVPMEGEFNNPVKGVKPISSWTGSRSEEALL